METNEENLIFQLIKGEISQNQFESLMKIKHLKVGTRVLAYGGNKGYKARKGIIRIMKSADCIGVEFDENIDGHDFYEEVKHGKDGHCWFIDETEIVKILEEGEENE